MKNIFFLLALSVVLSGCLQVSSHHTLRPDDTEDLILNISLKVPSDFSEQINSPKADSDEFLKNVPDNLRDNVTYNATENGVEIALKNVTKKEKEELIHSLPEKSIPPYTLSKEKGVFRYEINPVFILDTLELINNEDEKMEMAEITFLNHSVEVFGSVVETNGLQTSENSVSFWDMNPNEIYYVNFEERRISTDYWKYGVLFFISCLFILFIYFLSRKKEEKSAFIS